MSRKLATIDFEAHVANGGVSCPQCGSSNIGGDGVEIEAHGATQECYCDDCDLEWNNFYKLVRAYQ